jgi:hypothetical protein
MIIKHIDKLIYNYKIWDYHFSEKKIRVKTIPFVLISKQKHSMDL